MSVLFFWVVTLWRFTGSSLEDRDSTFLWNVGIYLWFHTALQPRAVTSSQWEPHNVKPH
jgi:hypothetical protein